MEHVEAIRLGLDHAIPCGLILNELLSNSTQRAFRDGRAGLIRISFKKTGAGSIELVVADDGVGLPAGFRLNETQSLGLRVVQILSKQLGADIAVAGEGGATFTCSWKPSAAETRSFLDEPAQTAESVVPLL